VGGEGSECGSLVVELNGKWRLKKNKIKPVIDRYDAVDESLNCYPKYGVHFLKRNRGI
jgi:hypothetical protein